MKNNRKYIYIAMGILAVIFAWNAKNLRLIVARHFGTVSSVDAVERMEETLKNKYPNHSFEWRGGDYRDSYGIFNDLYYTGSFLVDGQQDNIVSVTYSDTDYDSIWKGNEKISVDEKGYERKIYLVKRLCGDYTYKLSENFGAVYKQYPEMESLSVVSPYMDKGYEKTLPEGLEYEMEFTPSVELEWEAEAILRNYEGDKEKVIEEIVKSLKEEYVRFDQYRVTFIDGAERSYYLYDKEGQIIKERVEN